MPVDITSSSSVSLLSKGVLPNGLPKPSASSSAIAWLDGAFYLREGDAASLTLQPGAEPTPRHTTPRVLRGCFFQTFSTRHLASLVPCKSHACFARTPAPISFRDSVHVGGITTSLLALGFRTVFCIVIRSQCASIGGGEQLPPPAVGCLDIYCTD